MRSNYICQMYTILAMAVGWAQSAAAAPPEGFVELFNGKDFKNWKVPEGDNGHWKVVEGVIDYDASSEAPGDKNLWTEKEYGDFVLLVDWKIKETPYINPRVPIIKPDGTHKKDAEGKEIRTSVPDSDSGVFLRGQAKQHLVLADWFGRNLWLSDGCQNAAGGASRRNAEGERRPRHRPVEYV